MRILVTGGAGYIGSVLVPALLAHGHDVTVLDTFMYDQTSLLDCCVDARLDIVRGDVRDASLVSRLVSRSDAVFPLACLTGAPLSAKDPVMARAVNHDAVRSIAEQLSADQMLVFPSTNSGYGVGEDSIECDESTPLRPVSLYGRLKVDLEKYLLDRGNCVTFRFATLFGTSPRMRLDLLVNDFTYRAVVDRFVVLFEPHFKRNYLHVRDGARAFLHALEHYRSMRGKPYNVGLSDANISKWELCEEIRRHVPEFTFLVAELAKDPDQRNYIVSNKRIESSGYRTTIGLSAGVQELIKGYQVVRRSQHANYW
jgi:nucleoside-diphosphate-sugar epimerase